MCGVVRKEEKEREQEDLAYIDIDGKRRVPRGYAKEGGSIPGMPDDLRWKGATGIPSIQPTASRSTFNMPLIGVDRTCCRVRFIRVACRVSPSCIHWPGRWDLPPLDGKPCGERSTR